ncbi:FxsA family protein [Candidatus Laterigemmans baculatus]|uniref:FxsA family protein n=1 Tax=Candidatus Laterigemmans baculatus TaxID=2770505 RepID=UPI00193B4D07|nr:FxsA family protein [Candidatus Laterigemmans baculatus]
MLIKLLLAFILIPLVELFLLIWIAEQTSLLATIALVIVTGVIGSFLARRQGVQAWQRFRRATAEGRLPGREIQDGVMIGAAALLLLTPGILSDGVGFLLLVPAVRASIRAAVMRRIASGVRVQLTRGPLGSATFGDRPDPPRGDSRSASAARPGHAGRSETIDAVNVRPVSQR